MEPININPAKDTPKVILNAGTGIFEISGCSMPNDVEQFYRPIMDWLEEYDKSPNESTIVNFKFSYFNTASAKMLLDIVMILEKIPNVVIKWHFASDDDEMREAGEDFADIAEVAIEMIEY